MQVQRNTIRATVLAAAVAVVAPTVLAAPATAASSATAASPAATGSFEASCGGVPGGALKISWTREGTSYTATIDQYKLSPAHGQTNKNGEVRLGINGGSGITRTGLTADDSWHDLGASTTASVPVGSSIEHAFTLTYAGFPTYPHCSGTKRS